MATYQVEERGVGCVGEPQKTLKDAAKVIADAKKDGLRVIVSDNDDNTWRTLNGIEVLELTKIRLNEKKPTTKG